MIVGYKLFQAIFQF